MRHVILTCLLLTTSAATAALQVGMDGGNATCGNNTGYVIAYPSGGVLPYTFLWSNGAVTDTITGLAPGSYTVTVTDGNSDQVMGQYSIGNTQTPAFTYVGPGAPFHGCHGLCNNGMIYYEFLMPMNLVPPFQFSNPPIAGMNPFEPEQEAWIGMCDGVPFVTSVTDALGCVAQMGGDAYLIHGSDPGPMSVVSTQPSCAGMIAGSMTVNVGLESNSAYTPIWNSTLLDANMQPVAGHYMYAKPMMDQNVETEIGLPAGDYFVERRFFNVLGDCVDLLPVTIPSLGADCGVVNGTAFLDYNLNCLNTAEPAVPFGIVEVLPGPYYTTIGGNGSYLLCLPSGGYTLTQQSASVVEHCTGGPIPFTVVAGGTVQRPLPDTSVVALDLEAGIASGPARPGFQFQCSASVRNLTPSASGAITLVMTFDAVLGYLNASPAPASVVGNTITWNLAQLLAWQSRSITVNFSVPANPGLIGTQLISTVTVSSVNTDGDLANNTAINYRTITGSYDPNDKVARTSSGLSDDLYFIDADEWIDYTIRFQNTGTDTAFNILITDTLPLTLDPATLQIGAASHPFTWELRDQGTLKFYFQNILLPDSGYNEPLSHGLVSFRIRPQLPLLPGTVIQNIANIFFDFNPPVITEPSVLVAEFSTGVVRVSEEAFGLFPNPADEKIVVWVGPGRILSELGLYAPDGRLIRRIVGQIGRQEVDLSGLSAGIYLIRALTMGGEQFTYRFTKI